MLVSPPWINLRRAASYNHDKGPQSSTSSRFSFNHLAFSPPPSPGLPSLAPPLKKAPKGLKGLVRPRRLIRLVVWVVGASFIFFVANSLIQSTSTNPASAEVRRRHGQYEMVALEELPDFPTPIVVTDRKVCGHERCMQGGFPAVERPVCQRSMTFVLESENAGMGRTLAMLWTAYGLALQEGRAFFIDDTRWAYGKYTDIFQAPPLPGCRAPSHHELLPCPRQARHLVVSAATAQDLLPARTSFSFSSSFPNHHHHTEANNDMTDDQGDDDDDAAADTMDRTTRQHLFALARRGYEALFKLTAEDTAFVADRARELKARRHSQDRAGAGLAIGMHVRRGDRHPREYQYHASYVPAETYAAAAGAVLEDRLHAHRRHEGKPSHKQHGDGDGDGEGEAALARSFVLLASDDPLVYEADEFAPAAVSGSGPVAMVRAQERIKLASKAVIQQAAGGGGEGRHDGIFRKYVDDSFGWEGGFFAAMFWNLGLAGRSTGAGTTAAAAGGMPGEEALRLRSLVGRAYMLDLAVLAEASDVVVCTVSAAGCRLLAVMMGWEKAVERAGWVNVDGGFEWRP
ncbi:hypothetical protein P8C59_004078 [Phyllachora maydis]|uniref:Uncharacterized protein n=1 Tax=Phyllachora maydis TaxID=1825666 RepID=A0AAD9I1I8_9PEZI|nr:hypothetical protein P8C59_004078 [Phyllachora maydis]